MSAIDLLQRLWMATLAATAALALVGLLRRPWRRAFGAEQACRLWWLPVLAVLVSLLPHPASASAAAPVWISVHWRDVPAAPAIATVASRMPAALLVAWLAGAVLMLIWEAVRQFRFMHRLARPPIRQSEFEGMLLWHLPDAGQGPALVGCWRPRIVLPADFEHRFDAGQRALILAHECMHARRRDLPGLLLGVCLRALFWFHPLAWWAMRRLRQDQELACDAAMLRTRVASPRRYADTLLKTQLSSPRPAPIGCAWHTHPVKERITMLKHACPTAIRRVSGALIAIMLGVALVGTVYANTARTGHMQTAAATAKKGAEYQLNIGMDVTTQDGKGRHARRADMAVCTHPGEPASVKFADLDLDALLQARDTNHVSVKFTLDSSIMNGSQSMELAGPLGKPMHMLFNGSTSAKDGQTQRIVLDVTPIEGCPARTHVSQTMRKVSVRDAASTVAARAGYVLDNPEALSTRDVTFKFKDMDGKKALKLLAQVDGKQAVFNGNHVRIESH